MALALRELKAQGRYWFARRPMWWWRFDLDLGLDGEPLDERERLRLPLEHGELHDWEADRIREVADKARRRIVTDAEQIGPDAAAVALADLLEELSP
jgi:hypothetical protein